MILHLVVSEKAIKFLEGVQTDDKGELITRIKAVEVCLKTTGDVPCNIKFVIEGEEETGMCISNGFFNRQFHKE